MAFTWTGDPSASTLETIRWLIGDTVEASAKFQDAEINYAYDSEGSIYGAAALCCEQLSTRYSDAVSRSLGPLRVDLSDKASKYLSMAKEFRKKAAMYATPYGGGISVAKDEVFDEDSDLNQPIFDKGMMDND